MKKVICIVLTIAILCTTAFSLSVFAKSAHSPLAITNQKVIDAKYPNSVGEYVGFCLLSCLTLGWYGVIKESNSAKAINQIVPGSNMTTGGKLYLIDYLTCGIYDLIWCAKYKNVLNDELARRGIDYQISMWLIFTDYKLFKAVNLILDDYKA